MERRADALLTALHGGGALRCVQGHQLVAFNHHAVLKKAHFHPGGTRLSSIHPSIHLEQMVW